MIYAFKRFEPFMAFIIERHNIYLRRLNGKSQPWTANPILAQYRFCNVYRELDRTTEWIRDHWREPHKKDPHLWFALAMSRFVNHPDTMAQMGYPVPWNKKEFLRTMQGRRKEGLQVFGGAYIISTGGQRMEKAQYLADRVFDPLWAKRVDLCPTRGMSCYQFFARLNAEQGVGRFMGAQIVADLKYVEPLFNASDWHSFAMSGPGSRRGMSYILGEDPKMKWKEYEWKEALDELSELVAPHIERQKMPRVHNQDLQNCLCEFGKYMRTMLGTGRPKQNFQPDTGTY